MQDHEIVVLRYRRSLRVGTIRERSRGKVRVVSDKTKGVQAPEENVLLETGQIARELKELSAFQERVAARAAALEVPEVWELVVDEEKAFNFRELAELASDSAPDAEVLTAWLLRLDGEDCPWFEAEGRAYRPRPRDVVAQDLAKREAKATEQREDEALLTWLGSSPSPGTEREFSEHQSLWLDRIRDFVVEGEECVLAGKVKSFVAEVPGVGGDPRRALFQKLVEREIFTPHQHLDLERLEVPVEFSPSSRAAAAEFQSTAPRGEGESVLDLTELPCFSIDDASTTDIDDALSLESRDDGYRLGIHITDLSSLGPDSELDRLAVERVTTHYFPDRKIPMLPPELSEETGSLLEGKPRRVLSLLLDLDAELSVRSFEFRSAQIVNHRRLTYDYVDGVLRGESAEKAGCPPRNVFARLLDFARLRTAERKQRGAVELARSDLDIRIDEEGTIHAGVRPSESEGQEIVSELMILYNVHAAAHASQSDIPLIFRSQGAPDLNLADPTLDALHPFAKRHLLLKRTPPPKIGLEPGPHCLLGIEHYCQITSPLRRYADLLNQRQLATALASGAPVWNREELGSRYFRVEERLRQLRRLEFQRKRYWLLVHLQSRIGESFDAVVLELGDRLSQIEILEYGLRASALLSPATTTGEVVSLELRHVDAWEGSLRFASK